MGGTAVAKRYICQATGQAYPEKVQQVFRTWAPIYEKTGVGPAFEHSERLVSDLVRYEVLEPHKIGSGREHKKLDPEQLNLQLVMVAMSHVFVNNGVKGEFPAAHFAKWKHVQRGFETHHGLKALDFGTQDGEEYARTLETPDLGALVHTVDLLGFDERRTTDDAVRLADLNPKICAARYDPESDERERVLVSKAVMKVWSPWMDMLGYSDLAGDLMRMAYYNLNKELHDHVQIALRNCAYKVCNTKTIRRELIDELKVRLANEGYEFEILEREEKNFGKTIGKVDNVLKEKRWPISAGAIETVVSDLSDLVAFTVVLDRYHDGKKVKTIKQKSEHYKKVATMIEKILKEKIMISSIYNNEFYTTHTDKIRKPKESGYQSYHVDTKFKCKELYAGLEAIIRNRQMHENCKVGKAAHWIYKGGKILKSIARAYKNLIEAIRRGNGHSNGCTENASTYHEVQLVTERPQGKDIIKEVIGLVVMRSEDLIADALVAAGKGLKDPPILKNGLSLLDRVGDTTEIIIERNSGKTISGGTLKIILEKCATPATREHIQKLMQEQNGKRK
ncbi:MAG: hypothetical protein ABII39_00080 [Candidatus Micrarchaeota archaeon]